MWRYVPACLPATIARAGRGLPSCANPAPSASDSSPTPPSNSIARHVTGAPFVALACTVCRMAGCSSTQGKGAKVSSRRQSTPGSPGSQGKLCSPRGQAEERRAHVEFAGDARYLTEKAKLMQAIWLPDWSTAEAEPEYLPEGASEGIISEMEMVLVVNGATGHGYGVSARSVQRS